MSRNPDVTDVTAARVFICYVSDDRERGEALREALVEAGVTAWDVSTVLPGSRWRAALQAGLKAADAYVFLVSRSSVRSEALHAEVATAVAARSRDPRKRVIPVLIDKSIEQDLPPLLADYQWIDVSRSSNPVKDVVDSLGIIRDEPEDPRISVDDEVALTWDSLKAERDGLRRQREWVLARERTLFVRPNRLFVYALIAIGIASSATAVIIFSVALVRESSDGGISSVISLGSFAAGLLFSRVWTYLGGRRQ